MDYEVFWQDYRLDELQKGMDQLFPSGSLSLDGLLDQLMAGDIPGALAGLFKGGISDISAQFVSMRNIFVWLLVLGIVSALLGHFTDIFDKHQISDLSFYFIYLLVTAVLLRLFAQIAGTASEAMENIVLFIRLMVPAYLVSVGIATGTTTVGACYQMMLLLIYGVQEILLGVVLPLIYSYLMLSVVNGIWIEEKLNLLIDFLEKGIGWILKAALGLVTGISVFQSALTPVIDSVKATAWQKALSVIPGVGNAADGIMELVTGSAIVIKNSVGILLLLLLLMLCAAPLIQIFFTALLLKAAAAFMGIVSDKRITACANRAGDAGMLLFRTAGTAMLLFLIALAAAAMSMRR